MSAWSSSKTAAVPHRLHRDKGARFRRRRSQELIQSKRSRSSWVQLGYFAFSVGVVAIRRQLFYEFEIEGYGRISAPDIAQTISRRPKNHFTEASIRRMRDEGFFEAGHLSRAHFANFVIAGLA
jgi:hypothetical protein